MLTMNDVDENKLTEFKVYSSMAVTYEKGGCWRKAAEYWLDARKEAQNEQNKHWAYQRALYCWKKYCDEYGMRFRPGEMEMYV